MMARRIAIIATLAFASPIFGQPTAFTYQGRLKNGAQPAAGLHDFRFTLFNAASGGAQVGTTQCLDNLTVTDGVFTTALDFGPQFATTEPRFLQIEVRTDTGLACGSLSGFVTLGPRQAINPTPLASHAGSAFSLAAADGSPASAVSVDNDGRVGIGTTSPGGRLDIQGANSSNILFGRRTGGGLAHNLYIDSAGNGSMQLLDSTGTPRVEFANGVTYLNYGNVGIGTASPAAKLDVSGDVEATDIRCYVVTASRVLAEGFSLSGAMIQASNSVSNSTGVLGVAGSSALQSNLKGVHGFASSTEANSFGVFATGRLGATGTKAFRIDHPDDPAHRYLLHYCAESPEVINFYRGVAVLDSQGTAIVHLPPYFARINTLPSYQLTPVGEAMPMLHISQKISEQALEVGAAAGPGSAAPACWFAIAGGAPGGEVSWRVEAARNDEFVRRNGAPVEVDKPATERGTRQPAP